MIDDPMNRTKVKRGSQLPWAKLTEDDVALILSLVEERSRMKEKLKSLTNAALAEKFGVHRRTIEKIVQGEAWIHVQPKEMQS